MSEREDIPEPQEVDIDCLTLGELDDMITEMLKDPDQVKWALAAIDGDSNAYKRIVDEIGKPYGDCFLSSAIKDFIAENHSLVFEEMVVDFMHSCKAYPTYLVTRIVREKLQDKIMGDL